jgi:type I restriction enzyme, S subunit
MNVPMLRFKDNDGQDFPEWETKRLSELVKVYDGTHMTPDYKQSGVPFYSVEHLTNNNYYDTKFISEEVFEKENKRVKLEKGDILMTRIGDIGTPKYINWDVRASFYVSLALIKQSKKINSQYLSHFISAPYFQKELYQRTIHVAFPKKINLGEISECFVLFPNGQEQTKIANFLTAVDEKITQLTQKCDLLAQYKKGVMQQIFSQELRFKDDDGRDFPEWKEIKFFDALDDIWDYRGKTPNKLGMEWGGVIPSLSANNVRKGFIDFDAECNLGSEELYKKWMVKGDLSKNDLIFTMEAPLGNAALIPDDRKYILSQRVVVFKTKRWINNNFFLQILLSDDFQSSIDSLSTGTTAKGINQKSLAKVKLQLPLETLEQTKIANFLTAIDDKINNAQTQLAAVKQYKQGLLQQMFV